MTIHLNSNASTIIAFSKDNIFHGERSPDLWVASSSSNILEFVSSNGGIIAQAVGDSSVTLSNGKIVPVRTSPC